MTFAKALIGHITFDIGHDNIVWYFLCRLCFCIPRIDCESPSFLSTLSALLSLAILKNLVSSNSNLYVWMSGLVYNEAIDTVFICNVVFNAYCALVLLVACQIDAIPINNVLLIPFAICWIDLVTSFRHESLKEGHEIAVSVNHIFADNHIAFSFCFCNDYSTLGSWGPPYVPVDQVFLNSYVIRLISADARPWTVMNFAV